MGSANLTPVKADVHHGKNLPHKILVYYSRPLLQPPPKLIYTSKTSSPRSELVHICPLPRSGSAELDKFQGCFAAWSSSLSLCGAVNDVINAKIS